MLSARDIWLMIVVMAILVVLAFALNAGWGPVLHCKIVGDHEIVTRHCIPYCPPRPSECG